MRSRTASDGVEYLAIRSDPKKGKFHLSAAVIDSISHSGEELRKHDILIMSSKYVARSQGNVQNLNDVHPSKGSKILAETLSMDTRLAELVLRESEGIYGGVRGFALAMKNGVLAPNAGIDKSNIEAGWVVLHPKHPQSEADRIRRSLSRHYGCPVGVVLSDSRLMPTRIGTTGIAVAVAGFEPVKDERGRRDLYGNRLKVTQRALADDLASAAQLLMGEADEAIPIVIARLRGKTRDQFRFIGRRIRIEEMSVGPGDCIYINGLAKPIQY